jgi:hypothetical protein
MQLYQDLYISSEVPLQAAAKLRRWFHKPDSEQGKWVWLTINRNYEFNGHDQTYQGNRIMKPHIFLGTHDIFHRGCLFPLGVRKVRNKNQIVLYLLSFSDTFNVLTTNLNAVC